VYELARELGLSNKETVDLCNGLGIGVKSHSSSIVEPQADRVRRKAEREGLIREPQPEVAEPRPAEEAAPAAVSSKKAPPRRAAEPKPADQAEAPAPPSPAAPATRPEPPRVAPTPAPAAPAAQSAPRPPASDDRPRPPVVRPTGVVRSSGSSAPSRPREDDVPAAPRPPEPAAAPRPPSSAPMPPSAAPTPPPPTAAPAPPPAAASGEDAPRPAAATDPGAKPSGAVTPPKSTSGKPIPPPPGPMISRGGKPIPPPPGAGGRTASAPSGPGNRPARRGAAGQVRYTPPPPGAGPRPGGGPGGPGGPGGGRPGPGGGRRPPKRRGGRRRRNRDELQPIEAPSFTPREAPVPQGEVVIERASTPQDIGPKLNRTASDVVRFLMEQGEMVTATQSLTDDMIELFAAELGAEIRLVDPGEEQEVELQKRLGVDELFGDEDDDDVDTPHRPPIVTVMGHVDHGKTLLLDRIREANVVAGEAGGITQHIGAYQAERNGSQLTFIDTPGHEAFTAMRARGAEATDIVVLVVAADDGVMPQTLEALNHAKAADVPIVVAVNKMDREAANPDRVMQQLSEQDLIPEEWGGETIFAKVSALTGDGVDDLLDSLLLVAEVEDLRADPEGRAAGVVLESFLDIGRGPVATILVQRGTLRVGDPLVAGAAFGRVRALIDDHGQQIKEAGPSTPVQVLGLSDVADAGDQFVVAPDDKTMKDVAGKRDHFHRQANLGREAAGMGGGAKLEDIFSAIQAGETATLSLVLKADVNGSLQAVTDSLKKLERDEVKIGFVHRAVGGITENDIQLAAAAGATLIGFNVRPDRKARELAESEGVEIRTYEIIYKVIEDIEAAVIGMLEPEYEEVVTGDAEVREIFSVPRIGKIAGCMVLNGVITRNSKVRFLREGTIIWKGSIQSLRRFKDDAQEVRAGFECGIGLSDFQDLRAGDIIETYEEREIERS
jgi:translation initiation factor IF-2